MNDAAVRALIAEGEGPKVEFKSEFPAQARKIAKEIAAFATSDGGTILIGVADDGRVIGMPRAGSHDERTQWCSRIEGICRDVVQPPVAPAIRFVSVDGKALLVIEVPKGNSPVYYADGRPFVRQMSMARIASPEEVQRLILKDEILQRIGALEARGPEISVAAGIMGQGELATMNFDELARRLAKRQSRRIP